MCSSKKYPSPLAGGDYTPQVTPLEFPFQAVLVIPPPPPVPTPWNDYFRQKCQLSLR